MSSLHPHTGDNLDIDGGWGRARASRGRPRAGSDRVGRRWAESLPVAGLRVSILDVGQGDAILLQPAGAVAVLVDTGPPGADIAGKLEEAGVRRLGAAIVTHDQSDHAGGLAELLEAMPVDRVLFGALGRGTSTLLHAAGVDARRIAAGRSLDSGGLRLDVLWPPRELLAGADATADPNHLSLVMLARWRDFTMLLSADAEAESTPLDPGPLDVLKVAHHGSEDAGLERLLERTRPHLAVVSVGDGNPFGHPTPATLSTLANHEIPALRTDRAGTITLDVVGDSLRLATHD